LTTDEFSLTLVLDQILMRGQVWSKTLVLDFGLSRTWPHPLSPCCRTFMKQNCLSDRCSLCHLMNSV